MDRFAALRNLRSLTSLSLSINYLLTNFLLTNFLQCIMARVTLKDFNNFLSEHHVFSEFWRNFHEACIARAAEAPGYPKEDPYVAYQRLLSFNPIRWITTAFSWAYTSEGPIFWSHVNEDWCVFVKNVNARKQSKK